MSAFDENTFQGMKESINHGLMHCLSLEYNHQTTNSEIHENIKKDFNDICQFITTGTNIKNIEEIASLPQVKLSHEYFKNEPLSLISFDADKIHEYIFESNKFINIVGASDIIKKFNTETIYEIVKSNGLSPENIIYSGGGGGLIITPAFLSEKIKNEIERTFLEFTRSGTVSCVSCEVWPYEMVFGKLPAGAKLKFQGKSKFLDRWYCLTDYKNSWNANKCFGELVNQLANQLKLKKNSLSKFNYVQTTLKENFDGTCPSCGKRKSINSQICDICNYKEEMGQKTKQENYFAKSFEEIDKKYLGVVSADGNSVGKILLSLKTIVHYKAFSYTMNVLLDELSCKIAHECQSKCSLPICGGDDILAIVPRNKAFETAKLIIKVFSEAFTGSIIIKDAFNNPENIETYELIKKIGVAVGVLFVHSKFPAKYFVEYAEALQKSAKTKCAAGKDKAAIDYMLLTQNSPLNDSLVNYRKINNEFKIGNEILRMTDKPYSYTEFETLLNETDAMRGIKINQRYQFREFLKEGRQISFINFIYQITRHKDIQNWLQKCNIEWTSLDNLKKFLWSRQETDNQTYYTTRIQDMLEILKCVPDRGGESK